MPLSSVTISGFAMFLVTGELLDIIKADVIHIGIVAIGQQIVEIVLDSHEAQLFRRGDKVSVSTKTFAPTLGKI